jgi:hypothetical protein
LWQTPDNLERNRALSHVDSEPDALALATADISTVVLNDETQGVSYADFIRVGSGTMAPREAADCRHINRHPQHDGGGAS